MARILETILIMYRQLLTPLKAKCSQCNEEFEKIHWNQRFCDDCRIIRDKAHQKRSQLRIIARKKIKQKVCGHCFCLFVLNHGDRKYCTLKCYRRSNRIKHLQKRIMEIQLQIQELTAKGGLQ